MTFYSTEKPTQIDDHPNGYNYATGSVYRGVMTASFSDGTSKSWDVVSGGYYKKGSAIQEGDDSSTPAGVYDVSTRQNNYGLHGFNVNNVPGRDAILVHSTTGYGTHGCVGMAPEAFNEFAGNMNGTTNSSVPMSVNYNTSQGQQPVGNLGNHRSSSNLMPSPGYDLDPR